MSTTLGVMPHTSSTDISVVVNGEKRTIHERETIAGLVRALGLDPERLAIEMDRKIVKRAEWASTELPAGSTLEIVQFVGGG